MRNSARGTQLLSISALVFLGACTGGSTPTTTAAAVYDATRACDDNDHRRGTRSNARLPR